MFNDDGTQTRSGLFFEALRIIEATKPKIAIAENVKNLTGKKFKEQFELVLKSLEEAGYSNYWKVLNAKDYGIPQNRERVFIISIRKDIDKGFEFPEPFPLKLRLKDMLDDEVDEKFYLDSTKEYFIKHSFESEEKGNGFRFAPHVKKNANVAKTVTTRAGGRMDDNFVVDVECEEDIFKFDSTNKMIQEGLVIDDTQGFDGTRYYDNVSSSLRANRSGLKVVTDTATRGKHSNEVEVEQQLEISDSNGNKSQVVPSDKNDLTHPVCLNSKAGRGGIDGLQPSVQDRVYDSEAISTAVTTSYMPSVLVREATKQGYAEAVEGNSVNIGQPNSKTRRGRGGKQVSQTLTTSGGNEMAVVIDE